MYWVCSQWQGVLIRVGLLEVLSRGRSPWLSRDVVRDVGRYQPQDQTGISTFVSSVLY
jgi:hypothetical protein